ncbi:MAG: RHS repeat-associated core domain-containing protein [Actinomycetota bacterium]
MIDGRNSWFSIVLGWTASIGAGGSMSGIAPGGEMAAGRKPLSLFLVVLLVAGLNISALAQPYHYTAKRLDTGSQTIDMGARRFGPDFARFIQYDRFMGALDDLSLGSDPLTGNRYSLAGGNPVSFIESDGHRVVADGTAGASRYSTLTGGRTEGEWAPSVQEGAAGEVYGRPIDNPKSSLCPSCGHTGTSVLDGPDMVPLDERSGWEKFSDDVGALAWTVGNICEEFSVCGLDDALAEGDLAGAALSVAGIIPYGGLLKALRGVRAADEVVAVTKGVGATRGTMQALPRGGATLTQKGVEHIALRHWATSGAQNASKFASNVGLRDLPSMIDTTVRQGAFRSNTLGRPGHIYEFDFGTKIGTNLSGDPTSWLRVVVDPDGFVTTAFPF